MASILNWKKDDILLEPDRSGKLMETFVFQELAAQIDLEKYNYSLYQYRDHKRHEIDMIIEREDRSLLGIEVKAGHKVSSDDFAPQRWFVNNIIKQQKNYVGIVLYSGEDVLRFDDNMFAVPIPALWTN